MMYISATRNYTIEGQINKCHVPSKMHYDTNDKEDTYWVPLRDDRSDC